jgi:hypothetical protein
MAQGLKALLYLVQWRTWRLGGLEAWVAGAQLVNLPSFTVSNRAVNYTSTKFHLRDLPIPSFFQISIEISINRWGPSGALKKVVFGKEGGNFENLGWYFATGLGLVASIFG